jgi:hypothetical protein
MTKSGRERQFCFIPPQRDRSSFLSHFSFTFHKCSTQSCKGSFRMFGRRKRQICTLSLVVSHATKQCVVLFCSRTEILNMNPIRISHSDIGGILFGLSSKPILTHGFAASVRVPKHQKIDRNHCQFSLVRKK